MKQPSTFFVGCKFRFGNKRINVFNYKNVMCFHMQSLAQHSTATYQLQCNRKG